jgi:uncharacterized membrane protein
MTRVERNSRLASRVEGQGGALASRPGPPVDVPRRISTGGSPLGSMERNGASEKLAEEEAKVEGLDGTGSDMGRIISMSDAVFAFSMTFLVIDLVLPRPGGPYPDLVSFLGNVWPSMVAYAISFFIIASWWGAHRRLFSPIVRYDPLLVRLNNLFLLVIAITPFLVGILFDYGPGATLGRGSSSNELAVVIYASAQVLGGLLLLGVWRHSTRDHRLVEERLPVVWIRRTEDAQLTTVVVFAASVPVAFLLPFASMLMWIFVAISSRHFVLGRRVRRARPRPPSAGL